MSNFTTFYEEHFIRELENQKKLTKNQETDIKLATFANRVGRMADSGAGITVLDLERYMGRNDLLRFNYLSRGMQAGKAVCRIYVADKFGGGSWGTGFLITPNLIITNNHVIPDSESATRSFAEFGYEADNNGLVQQGKRFKIQPEKTFVTSIANELDITILGVSDIADDGISNIADYGFLRMNPALHKVEELEFVSIIQHPSGDEKYISIRENKVIKIGDANPDKDIKIWYECDTAKGSSGAAVFNDQWQVVALHHSSVADSRNNNGTIEVKLASGEWIPKNEEDSYEENLCYIANEGIRTSRIVAYIKNYIGLPENQTTNLSFLQEFLDDVLGVKSITTSNTKESIASTIAPAPTASFPEAYKDKSKNIWPIEHYIGRKGYQDDFLGITIPLPEVTPNALKYGPVTPVQGTLDNVLRYQHFSVIHNSKRKIAFVTAVNIDGSSWKNITRGVDKWYYDSRIPLDVQLGEEMYSNEPSPDGSKKGWFDRGHLVRRQDPDWGTNDEALLADEDTFHWANCSPQYWFFNQKQELWQGLENYILYNTDKDDLKASVFSGPVFDENDEPHRGVQIPQYFFKIVAVIDSTGKLFSSAYVVSQKKWAIDIPFEVLPVGDHNNFQTTIAKVEQMTGLRFPDALREADVRKDKGDVGLRSLADVAIPRRK